MRQIIDETGWKTAHAELLAQEKAATAELDRIAALRRRLPWQRIDKSYAFVDPGGGLSLQDLFDGRRQLLIYHHMLKKADPAPCPGCAMVGDQMPNLTHLNQRNTTLTFVSRAPISEIMAFRQRMGWQMPWVETVDDFNQDLIGMRHGPAVSVFIRDGKDIFRSYLTTGRGLETLGTIWQLLDLTPLGRQEKWEDSPEDVTQTDPYVWWRLHDSYGPPNGKAA